MQGSAVERKAYRLYGLVAGIERMFLVHGCEHRVGRSPDNDVWLPVTGVSRVHAALRITPEGVAVEDLGSANGTFVDHRRIESTVVTVGELRFGPVRLRLEAVDAEDADLALAFDVPSASAQTEARELLVETVTEAEGVVDRAADGDRLGELVFPDGYRPGTAPVTEAMYRQMHQLLRGYRPVLIVGETGVGKEQAAKILHASSGRRQGPFVAINCAAIPAEMLEAEMFGIGKGVATGVDGRPGKFQLAVGGTLFLDEISEMVPALQAKLLRALQEREIQPVGGETRRIDVRIIAATNVDLVERMEDGTFRRDLYYRLAGHELEVPALRRARADVPGLVEHFLRAAALETGTRVRGVTAKALRLLTAYAWPGNVRELEHEMHRLVCASVDGEVIDSRKLADRIRDPGADRPEAAAAAVASSDRSLALEPQLRALETRLVCEALERAGGKQVQAAKLLGISRNGLAKKIKRLGIAPSYSRP